MNKKAFTLIELLAVIVILAIITLIAVPIVLGIINDTKISSNEQTIYLYMDAVKKAIANENMKVKYNPDECEIQENSNIVCYKGKETLKTSKGLEELEIEMRGTKPSNGIIKFNNNKLTYKEVVLENIKYALDINGNKSSKVYEAPTLASNTTNYTGYYADVDGDGIVDGIIFADLLIGSIRETQQWGNTSYLLPTNLTNNNVKKYYISSQNYVDTNFGTHQVIFSKTSRGQNRFYVMQLSDFQTAAYIDSTDSSKNHPAYTVYYWYKNAYDHMNPLITTNNFGKGSENTQKMLEKWNAAGTGEGYIDSPHDNQDIWKHIQTKYSEGWFLPSREEWAAFANEIGGDNPITTENFRKEYGLSNEYMTSSQYTDDGIWRIYFNNCNMYYASVRGSLAVRLARTF